MLNSIWAPPTSRIGPKHGQRHLLLMFLPIYVGWGCENGEPSSSVITPSLINRGTAPPPRTRTSIIVYFIVCLYKHLPFCKLRLLVEYKFKVMMKGVLGLLMALAVSVRSLEQIPLKPDARPNIILVLTDDQDLHMQSVDYMPLLKKHVIDRGTFYKRHYCSTAICCPSRVTLWTGRNAHNTNVTDVFPPYGQFSGLFRVIIGLMNA